MEVVEARKNAVEPERSREHGRKGGGSTAERKNAGTRRVAGAREENAKKMLRTPVAHGSREHGTGIACGARGQ